MVTKTMRLLLAAPVLLGAFFAVNAFSKTTHSLPYTEDDSDRFYHSEVVSGEGYFTAPDGQPAHIKVSVVKDRYGDVTGQVKYEQNTEEYTVALNCLQARGGEVTVSGKTPGGKTLTFRLVDNSEAHGGADLVSAPVEGSNCPDANNLQLFALTEGTISLERK